MQGSNLKREVVIKEFRCPFCDSTQTETIRDVIINKESGGEAGFGMDYWECRTCGFEKFFKPFKSFVENGSWEGLFDFCKRGELTEFSAFDYAKWLIQKKEFRKALGIFDVLLKVDPKDVQSEHLKNHLENLLKCLDIQKRVPFKFEDVMEALEGFEMTEYYLDIKTGDIIRISELESEEDKEQITEEDRYIYIESIPSFEKYKWMEQFINMIGHEKAKRELRIAISGKEAFSRFSRILSDYPEVQEWWYGFKAKMLWDEMMGWVIGSLGDKNA